MREKAEKILRWGGCGLEFGLKDVNHAEQIRKALEGTGVSPAAICWTSHHGDFVAADPARRKKAMDDLKEALETAAALGSNGVVWIPCFSSESKLTPAEMDKVYDILPEIAALGEKAHSRILIEPLNKAESIYLNRIEQTVAWCRKINSPGVCTMGDFYHMAKEEKDQEAAFVTGGKWVHHVHLATEKHRILPGQEPHSFVAGFRGLKRIGYRDFCSLECGVKPTKEVSDGKGGVKLGRDPDAEIPKAFAFLKRQWEEAWTSRRGIHHGDAEEGKDEKDVLVQGDGGWAPRRRSPHRLRFNEFLNTRSRGARRR